MKARLQPCLWCNRPSPLVCLDNGKMVPLYFWTKLIYFTQTYTSGIELRFYLTITCIAPREGSGVLLVLVILFSRVIPRDQRWVDRSVAGSYRSIFEVWCEEWRWIALRKWFWGWFVYTGMDVQEQYSWKILILFWAGLLASTGTFLRVGWQVLVTVVTRLKLKCKN